MSIVDAVVVGGGAIGCAIARRLTLKGWQVLVLEKNAMCGMETSSRISEVIHAGIYYPSRSLKARLCVNGRDQLVSYMKERKINHHICSKLIVATEESELQRLEALFRLGQANGVRGLEYLTSEQVKRLEPQVHAVKAIWSPNTGIFDSHDLLQHYISDIEADRNQSQVVANCEFQSAAAKPNTSSSSTSNRRDNSNSNNCKYYYEIETSLGAIQAFHLINAGGLNGIQIAHRIAGPLEEQTENNNNNKKNNNNKLLPTAAYYAKGRYCKLSPSSCSSSSSAPPPFSHLVYPLPTLSGSGLGIHATIDLQGQVRFGPDVVWMKPVAANHSAEDPFAHRIEDYYRADYSFTEENKEDEEEDEVETAGWMRDFQANIARYYPGIVEHRLVRDYTGIRPKLGSPSTGGNGGGGNRDFLLIKGEELGPGQGQGQPQVVHCLGMESPGWTASLAIADHVVDELLPS